jgi:hypothetical protein
MNDKKLKKRHNHKPRTTIFTNQKTGSQVRIIENLIKKVSKHYAQQCI